MKTISGRGYTLEIFEKVISDCCQRNHFCQDCCNLETCTDLWFRACEQDARYVLASQQLNYYLDQFAQLQAIKQEIAETADYKRTPTIQCSRLF